MISNLGTLFLIFSIFFASLQIILFYLKNNSNEIIKNFYIKKFLDTSSYNIVLNCISIIISYFLLVYAFVSHDFSVSSVFFNSSTYLPIRYLVSGSWASHETSLLFWLFCNSFVILIFYSFFSKEEFVFLILMKIQMLWSLLIILKSNPFFKLPSSAKEGMGMNALLQDFAMIIHPPILYLSYSLYLICFAYSISRLKIKDLDKKCIKIISSIAISMLTFAIGLGGWWAYRELGWGGYWFFDPVENISLLVWLFGIIFHHSIIQNNMFFTSIISAICAYLSCIWGTFLVRSGVLVSVHSFAETDSSKLLFIISVFISLYSIYFIMKYFHKISNLGNYNLQNSKNEKYYWMQIANLGWFVSAIIIICTLVAPIIIYLKTSNQIEVEPSFFYKTLVPTMIFASSLSGIIYFRKEINLIFLIISLSIISSSFFCYFFHSSWIIFLGYSAGISILLGTIIRFFQRYNDKNTKLSSSFKSMILGHLSCAFLILSLCINNHFSFEVKAQLTEGDFINYQNYKIKLEKLTYAKSENYLKTIAKIIIFDELDNEITYLKPELRYYNIEKTLTSDADIFSFLFYDWYGVIASYEDDKIILQIFKRYSISIIWISILFMSLSFVFSMIIRKEKINL